MSDYQSKAIIFTDSIGVTYRISLSCFAASTGYHMAVKDYLLPRNIVERIALIATQNTKSHWVAGNTDIIEIK